MTERILGSRLENQAAERTKTDISVYGEVSLNAYIYILLVKNKFKLCVIYGASSTTRSLLERYWILTEIL